MPSVTWTSIACNPLPVAVPVMLVKLAVLPPVAGVVMATLSETPGRTVKVIPRVASGGMPLVAVNMRL